MVSHAHITRLRPRHAYFSADSGCDRSGVAINVIFLIFSQIVTVWILVPGRAHKRILVLSLSTSTLSVPNDQSDARSRKKEEEKHKRDKAQSRAGQVYL